MQEKIKTEFWVNGDKYQLELPVNVTLAEILRENLGLTGTKISCGKGECGSCTVLFDGKPVNSCLILAPQVSGHHIVTIEGLPQDGKPLPLQQAFVEEGAVQCGYCIPGMIISAHYLLQTTLEPSEQQIREAISGNLCRCTGYTKIIKAIQRAAKTTGE